MANGLGIFHKSHSFEMDADIYRVMIELQKYIIIKIGKWKYVVNGIPLDNYLERWTSGKTREIYDFNRDLRIIPLC